MAPKLSGSCQCGAVHYRVNSAPVFTYACHCRDCQKRSGSAFSMGTLVALADLELDGELSAWRRTSDEGSSNTRYSCAACGNIIYGAGETSADFAKLQTGTLDDSVAMQPHVHIWTSRKQAWLTLPADVPQFETQPAPMAQLQAALDYQAGA
jgi:hypothetical protein